MKATGAVVAVSALVGFGVASAPAAHHADDWALNGTYVAVSNGDWAATNDVYRNEATVRSTWTISMSCSQTVMCTGRVKSDAGWSADIRTSNTEYVVERDLPGWEPCADGTTVAGHQRFHFFPVDDAGFLRFGSHTFAGFDKTVGVSGGCGVNDMLEIALPFRLDKLS